MNKDVWLNVWANFLAIIIGIIFLDIFKKRNLINFFGLKKQNKLTIYLSSLYIPHNTALTYTNKIISFQGLVIPEYEHQVIPFFSNLFTLITTGKNVFHTILNKMLLGNVDISYINTPLQINSISFHNLICIGGPSANIVTNYYLRSNLNWLGFNSTNNGIEIKKGKRKGQVLGLNNSNEDFGILEKIIDKKNDSIVFIAAGGNYMATKAAAYYLSENWRNLQKEFKNNGFALCIKTPQHFIDNEGYKYPKIIYKVKH
jgi:hypothetical protein